MSNTNGDTPETVELPPELEAEIQSALAEVQSLRAMSQSILVDRAVFGRKTGLMTFNGQRDVDTVLGYADKLTPQDYRIRYERGGIAGRAVDALPKACWRGDGELIEDQDPEKETEFEAQWWLLNDRLKVWSTLQRLDILAQLGRYACLLIGAPGEFDQEIPKGTKQDQIIFLTPFAEDDAAVSGLVSDGKDPRFGKPKGYKLKRTDIDSPDLQKDVHPSRIIHVPAEGFLDSDIYGPPALQGCWNDFDDLVKVSGGGSEAFWLRANQGLHLDIDKNMKIADAKNTLASLKAQAAEYKHQLTRWLRTRGVKATTLGSDVADFSGPQDAKLTLIAGTRGIPKRILTGSEMGQLASSQDRDNWQDQVQDRRTSYCSPIIARQFADRLLRYGYLPKPKEYSVRWPTNPINAGERMDLAGKAAALNDHGMIVIEANEIRDKILEYEPLAEPDVPPPEGDVAISQLENALRRGGVVNLVVRGAAAAKVASGGAE